MTAAMKYPDLYVPFESDPGIWKMFTYRQDRSLLKEIINPGVPYIWIHNYAVGGKDWELFNLPVFGKDSGFAVKVRSFKLDFIVSSQRFLEILPELDDKPIHLVQLYEEPPYFLMLDQVSGMTKYELLKRSGFYLEYLEAGDKGLGEFSSSNGDLWKNLNRAGKALFDEIPEFTDIEAVN